tara:strand:- start:8440 stop:9564 length:1125 start_codon:yes stop_codon:yes gene_type:complete
MADNQTAHGHYRLYSYPEKLAKMNSYEKDRYKKIVFVSSNNLNGHFAPKSVPVKNRFNENREIIYGGLAAMKAYQEIFKKTYDEKVLFVDAGSFLNTEHDQQKAIFYANYYAPDVMALGHTELINLARVKENIFGKLYGHLKVPFVASNLFNLKKAKDMDIKNVRQSYIKSVHNLKVGFISTINQSFAAQVNKEMTHLYIQNETKTILAKASELRRQGAQIIVLLTTSSIDCNSKIAKEESIDISKVNFDPYESDQCDHYKNNLSKVLAELPPKSLDLVIASGESAKIANFIQNYPVIQNEGQGEFFSWAEIYYDTKHQVVDLGKSKIYQPVQLCHNFIKSTQDCYVKESIDNQDVSSAFFLGEKVQIKPLPQI